MGSIPRAGGGFFAPIEALSAAAQIPDATRPSTSRTPTRLIGSRLLDPERQLAAPVECRVHARDARVRLRIGKRELDGCDRAHGNLPRFHGCLEVVGGVEAVGL